MGITDKWTAIAGSAKGTLKNKLQGFMDAKKTTATGSTDPNLNNRNYTVMIKQSKGPTDLIVVGTVPQSFQIQQSVDWKAPWGAGLGGSGNIGDLIAVTGNRLVAQIMTMQVWQGSGNDFEFTVQFELRAWSDPVRDVLDPLRSLLKMSLPSIGENGFLKSPGPVLSPEGIKIISGQFTQAVTEGSRQLKDKITSQTADGTRTALGVGVEAGKTTYETVSSASKTAGAASKRAIEENLTNKISIQIGQWFHLDNIIVTQVQHDIKGQTPDRKSGVIQSASVTVSFKPMFSLTADDVDGMLRAGNSVASAKASPTSLDPRAAARGQLGY